MRRWELPALSSLQVPRTIFCLWRTIMIQQQMVLMVVHPDTVLANIINIGDDVDVITQITMSFADYQTFGNNGSLTFV